MVAPNTLVVKDVKFEPMQNTFGISKAKNQNFWDLALSELLVAPQ